LGYYVVSEYHYVQASAGP